MKVCHSRESGNPWPEPSVSTEGQGKTTRRAMDSRYRGNDKGFELVSLCLHPTVAKVQPLDLSKTPQKIRLPLAPVGSVL
jgi:hypothetical protein